MPTQYEPHPNSTPEAPMWNVTLPTGAKVPMAVSEEQLKQAGAMPVVPPEEDRRTAQLAPAGAGNTATDAAADPFGIGAGKPQKPIRMDVTDEQAAQQEKNYAGAQKEAMPKPEPAPQTKAPVPKLRGGSEDLPQAPAQSQGGGVPYGEILGQFKQPSGGEGKPRMVMTGYTQQVERPFDSDYAEQSGDTLQARADAETRRANAEATALEQQAAMRDQAIRDREEGLRQEQEKRAAINAELNKREVALEGRRNEYRKMSVDPGRYYSKRGGFLGALVASIASGAGTWAALATGGRNYAKETLDAGIEREVAAQRANIEKKGNEIAGEESQLAKLYQIHGDPATAEREFRVQAYDIAEEKAKAFAMRSQSDQVRANLDKFIADLNDSRNRELSDMRAAAQGKIAAQFKREQSGGGLSPLQQANKLYEGLAKLKENYQKVTGGDETGQAIYNPFTGQLHGRLKDTDIEKGEASKVREKLAIGATIDEQISKLKYLIANKNLSADRQAFEEAQATAKDLKFSYRQKKGTGAAMSESEEKDIDAIIVNDPSTWQTADKQLVKRLDTTQKNQRNEVNTTLRSVGMQPIQWGGVGAPE